MSTEIVDGLTELGQGLVATLGDTLTFEVRFEELSVSVPPDGLHDLVRTLRDDPKHQFICFIDLCGVDYPQRAKRFDVVIHLLSPKFNQRIRIKTRTDENTPVPTISDLFPAANWFEREAYDLYGILFAGHPDLRRILTDYGFEGHPLRKDFPMSGFVEVRWDDLEKRVVNEPVRLTQEFRNWDFLSPWEGVETAALPGDEKATQ